MFKTLRFKVLASNFVLYILLLTSFFLVYEIALSNIRNITIDLLNETIEKDKFQVNGMIQNVESMALLISSETEIQNALRAPLPLEKKEVYQQRVTFNHKIHNMQKYMSQIDGVFVLGNNGTVFRSSNKSLLSPCYTKEKWYQQVVESKQPLWLDPNQPSLMIKNLGKDTISYIQPIWDKTSFQVLGVVVIELLSSELDNYFTDGFLRDGGIFIMNQQNEVTYSNNPDALASYLMLPANTVAKNFTSETALEIDGWKLIAYVPEKIVFSTLYRVRTSIILVFGLMSLIVLVFGWVFERRTTAPIQKMQKNMKQVEKGNFDIVLPVESQDEIGQLTISFNHMLAKIKTLVAQQRKQQEQLEKAELMALQSQVNPHFLYNTLDSINWMARMNQLNSVSSMVEALTKVFRISLSRGAVLIPVRDEITHVSEYMKIQQYRYGNRVKFNVDIPDEYQDSIIVKIVLQPLVENALYHGLKQGDLEGSISISACDDNDDILFMVEDTGQGMSKTRLAELNQILQSGLDTSNESYGVINVQRRLKVYFGDEYGLHYEKSDTAGTNVILRIPKKRKE